MAVITGRTVPLSHEHARSSLGRRIAAVLSTTDHKLIGRLYLATSFAWFLVGGLMALVIRAELAFPGGLVVSARPSDAIALAIRTGAAIRGERAVLEEAGIAIPDEQEDEVEKFREFLDTITPEDFERGAEPGPPAV